MLMAGWEEGKETAAWRLVQNRKRRGDKYFIPSSECSGDGAIRLGELISSLRRHIDH
jgi:hypothetical protein